MKKLVILGSTGSIGKQSLDVARFHHYEVEAIAACRSVKLLEEQIREFHPKYCAVADENAAEDLKIRVADENTKILSGVEGVCALPSLCSSEKIINSIVGRAGLLPTMAVIDAKKTLALANKESLVCAGTLVKEKAKKNGVSILPVDSEHSAIFQCLHCGSKKEVERILLTASGGPFFGKKKKDLENMTAKEALQHPTWSMGAKITVDSSTLMNKGFEVMEAVHLFDVEPKQIEVLVHRESIVHSMVEFRDHTVIAELSNPDMRDCIQYALTYPSRLESPVTPLDFEKVSKLTFHHPDMETFPLLPLALEVMEKKGLLGAVLNGANEGAVAAFLKGKITFNQISELIIKVVSEYKNKQNPSLEEICMAGEDAEQKLLSMIS